MVECLLQLPSLSPTSCAIASYVHVGNHGAQGPLLRTSSSRSRTHGVCKYQRIAALAAASARPLGPGVVGWLAEVPVVADTSALQPAGRGPMAKTLTALVQGPLKCHTNCTLEGAFVHKGSGQDVADTAEFSHACSYGHLA